MKAEYAREQLKSLEELRLRGAITPEEFEAERKELLALVGASAVAAAASDALRHRPGRWATEWPSCPTPELLGRVTRQDLGPLGIEAPRG